MDIDWNAELVDQLEWHWQHQLRPRLDGLTDDEYYWQPVRGCWTISRRGQSPAPISLGAGEFTMDYAARPRARHHHRLETRPPHRRIRATNCTPLR
jgi:hypothetical protein